MPWVITLHVTGCASHANIAGAFITDGISTSYTDSYGDFTAVVYDDVDPAYVVNVGKSGYVTRYTVLSMNQAGTTLQVCLDVAPVVQPGPTVQGCFIVSATTGSADSAENMRLNMLRDRVLRSTDIGAALLDAIYADYYSFSPPIADELATNAQLRNQVLQFAVRPLLAWWGLIEILALDRDSRPAAERAARGVVDACRAASPHTPVTTATLVERLRRGEPIPADAPGPFGYLASRLDDAVTLPFSAWAIFEPLALAWQCVASGSDLIEQATLWLARAPLDQLPPPVSGDRLDSELAQLAHGPFADPALRDHVGERLAGAWPHLADDLVRHGFIEPHGGAAVSVTESCP